MKTCRIAGDGKLVAKYTFTEHLGELRQKLQMLLCRMFRHEQHEYLSDWLAVRRIEGNRLARSHERAQRVVEPRIRPCGIAIPCPSPVEPSFSRANRLSNTTERPIRAWSSNS